MSTGGPHRYDPEGRAALFGRPPEVADDLLRPGNRRAGRAALYSTGPRQTGTVVIECSDCGGRARSGMIDLGLRLLSVSVWLPTRRHSHWMRCPSCHQHTWCRVGWTE